MQSDLPMAQKPSFDSVDESNPDKPSVPERTRTTNEEGAEAFEPFTPEFGLYKVVLNNLLEDSFYDTADESFETVWNRFDRLADENPEFVLQLATYARQEEGFRDIAQLLLVLSANDSRTQQYVRDYTPVIIDRTDEFNTVVSYQLRGYGSPIPKPLKKGITDALHKKYVIVDVDGETFRQTYVEGKRTNASGEDIGRYEATVRAAGQWKESNGMAVVTGVEEIAQESAEIVDEGYVHNDYTCAKYSQRNKEVSLHDVLNLVRPAPRSENRDDLFGQIVLGELDDREDIEALREERTWESEMSSADIRTFETTVQLPALAQNTVLDQSVDEDIGTITLRLDKAGQLRIEPTLDPAKLKSVAMYNTAGATLESVDFDEQTATIPVSQYLGDAVTIEVTADFDDRTDAEKFRERLDDMGLMARVRNLRNMREAGISGSEIFDYDDDVVFGENSLSLVREHQMFPFRFYQAYKACGDVGLSTTGIGRSADFQIGRGELLDTHSEVWLNKAMDVSTENLPDSLENTFTAVDLSGSMDAQISGQSEMSRAEIGTLFGAMLLKRDSDVGAFGRDFAQIEATDVARRTNSVLDLAQDIYSVSDEVGGATNGWKAIDFAIENDRSYDRFVVFTDEQIWDSNRRALFSSETGRTLKDAWDDYTDEVNPDAHLYICDLASYGDLSMPEGYHNVHQISGWSSNVIDFIDSFEQADDVVAEIAAIDPDDY